MKSTNLAITLATTTTLALAACAEPAEPDPVVVEDQQTMLGEIHEDVYPVAGDLDDAQLANLDAMDAEAISAEYDANQTAMMEEASAQSGSSMSSGSMDSSMEGSSSGMNWMPARGEMDFAWLDRNGDGQLSVAEYAIWALPTDPTEPEPNDARPPYLEQEEINQAAQSFFYFDDDGSTYLSQSEFMDARNSSQPVA